MQWLVVSAVSGLCLGIVVADGVAPLGHGSVATWPALVFGVGAALSWLLPWVRRRPWTALLLGGFTLGFWLHLGAVPPELPDTCIGPAVSVRGVVSHGQRPLRDGRGGLRVDVEACSDVAVTAALELVVPPGTVALAEGDRVEVQLKTRSPRAASASYTRSELRRAASRGLSGRGFAVHPGDVKVVHAGTGVLSAIDRFRIGREEDLIAELGPRRAAPLLAIATGSKGLIERDQRRPFDRAGLSHLLAISGLHLMTLALLGLLIERGLRRLRPRWAQRRWVRIAMALVPLTLVLGYATLAGWPLSVRRAAVMLAVWQVAKLVDREPSVEVSLALAVAMVLLGESTHALFEPGLQLSVSAVAGLALGLRHGRGRHRWARRWLAGALGASAATNAACAPWLALHFGRIPMAGVLLNLVAVPLVQILVLPASLLALLFGDLEPGPTLAHRASDALVALNQFAEACPLAGLGVGISSGLALWLGTASAAWCLWRRRPRTALGVLFISTLAAGTWSIAPPPEVRFLPVGDGDSILVRGGGATALIDGGGARGRSPGRDVIIPALRRSGVRHLDLVVVTHTDLDHVGGLIAVIDALPPTEVWWDRPRDDSALERQLCASIRRSGATLRSPPTQARLGGLKLRRVDRPDPLALDGGLSKNDRSLVLEIQLGPLRMLTPGDVERLGEWRSLGRTRPVHLLKAPHHGSASSSSPAFLAASQPKLVVIEAGEGNRFGHPHRVVLDRYRHSGVRFLSTAACGEVVVRVQQRRALVSAHRPCP